MKTIVRQNVNIEKNAGGLGAVAELPQEAKAVGVGQEDLRPPIAAGGDVIEGVGKVDALAAWHGGIVAEPARTEKLKIKA
jgi:hypothetical protein